MFYIPILTIAGSDCSGGAGLQADIKTMSALGCYAASVVTSITVQNTCGVEAVCAVPPAMVGGQIRAVMEDIRPKAVKVGMVNDAATIHAIAETLKDYDVPYLIVDPVMVSSSGSRLMEEDALNVFVDELLPMATLLTPNVPEAEVLAGMRIASITQFKMAAEKILALRCHAVLIKGGHLEGNLKQDNLYMKNAGGEMSVYSFHAVSVVAHNTHGTGCTLSSAISSFLAIDDASLLESEKMDEQEKLVNAISKGKEYVTEALKCGQDVEIGKGTGPLNHFFAPCPMRKVEKL